MTRLLAVAAWVLLGAVGSKAAGVDPLGYAGSDQCRKCHVEKYDGWKQTFHATVVQNAKENPSAILGDFSQPALGFTLADVEYTIGGHWDQRYMKKIGDDYFVLPKLWSVQAQAWRPYNVWAWRKKPYSKNCKGCHVTAYDPGGNVPVSENRIGCEACHGPGWDHARTGGEAKIVNPRRLPRGRSNMICAACHVRGTDRTGEYAFPVGFVPGEDLGQYYVPQDKEPGETNTQAILRLFAKWEEQRASASKMRCEVCGIEGPSAKEGPKTVGKMDFCFGCHGFQDKYAEHSRHPAEVNLTCFDCHVQQKKEIINTQAADIHTPEFFLLHEDNCYDRRMEKACQVCHADKGEEWVQTTVERWRRPVEVDH